ncbi:MAG TPA: ABC transporter permease [Bryobacteraceae bacterium]|nr:ABC transporter permease [Bryobacteraceae bacterium]
MRFVKITQLRLRSLFSRRRVEEELDEELQYHLDRQIDEYVTAGMSRAEARSAALREIAGLTQRKEECRDMRGFNFIDNLLRDFRYAVRQLHKNLGFTFTAVFVLALGTCASVSIFAFVDAALIKPLPYRDPARLVGVYEHLDWCPYCNLSYPDYVDWKQRNVVFSSFDIYQSNGAALGTAAGPQPVRMARVSDGFLRTLGVAPVLGRDFVPGDDMPSAPRTAMLTYAAWQGRFGGKADIVGQAIRLDDNPVTIIAVLPREFQFAPVGRPDFLLAYQPTSECDKRRSCHGLYGIARLKDGVSFHAALSNVSAIAAALQKEYPESNNGQGGTIEWLTEVIGGNYRPLLLVLLGGAGLLLLIASVNVAGLQLVRSESRGREIAVRTALGASSGRLIGQFLTEAVVIAAAGSLLGVLAAHWMILVLKGLISEKIMAFLPFWIDLGVNRRVLAVAAAIAVAAAALLAMPSSGRVWTSHLQARLSEASRGSAGTTWRRVGSRLVVLELATAMVLLAGAGLLGKSLYILLRVSVGFQPERLLTLDVALPTSFKTDSQTIGATREIDRAIGALPGVRSVGLVGLGLPLQGNGNTTWFHILGRPWHGEHEEAPQRDIGTTYFQTLGAKLIAGRYFDASEDSSKPLVTIVNQSFVRKYFPNQDPVGGQIAGVGPGAKPMQIVGVVENIREGPLDADIPPVVYVPFTQNADTYFSLAIRTSRDERSLLPAVHSAIRQVDRDIVPIGGAAMTDLIEDSQSAYVHRSVAWLVGGFAALALLLGVVGLYGVIAYSVSQRSREIGIRMALGAQTGSVYRLILREAGWLTAVGIAIGIGGAVGAATLMRDLLFGVRTWDLATLACVAALLGAASLAASLLPARRAAAVNPVDALRAE